MELQCVCINVLFVFTLFVHVVWGAISTPYKTQNCSLTPPSTMSNRLVGEIISCSAEHKKCLRLNKVLFEGKCYEVGSPGPCRTPFEVVVIDKAAFLESNLVIGTCRPLFACNRNVFQEHMAHDQCCYETSDIRKYICSPEKKIRLRKNVFGEGECHHVSNDTAPLLLPNYELQKGYCYFPNISFPYKYGFYTSEERFNHLIAKHELLDIAVHCSAAQQKCFENDEVLFPADQRCYPLLTRGPCLPGSWLVLDQGALEAEGSLVPVCAASRCLPGQLFMSREQRCRDLRVLQTELCAGDDLLFDVFGETHCSRFARQEDLLRMPKPVGETVCVLKPETSGDGLSEPVAVPNCGSTNYNKCKPYVQYKPSPPEF